MAHFRGTIEGTRGTASRLGTKNSGLRVKAQTWGWDLETFVMNRSDGHDVASLTLIHHTTGERRALPSVNLTTGEILK